MRKKVWLTILLALLLIDILVGCSGQNRFMEQKNHNSIEESDALDARLEEKIADNDLIVVGFSQVGAESDWRVVNTESFQETFSPENGYYLLYEDAQQKQENQLKAIRSFILQDVDYIVCAPIVETGWDSVLKEAKDAGIPVIFTDRMVEVEDESLYICWVGSDFRKEGEKAGRWLESYLAGKGRANDGINIVTLRGTEGATAQIGRSAGFNQVLLEHRNWRMLDSETADFTQAKGREVMEEFLDKYRDIDVVVCENDNMAFGAIAAIHGAGRTCGPNGEITVISFDATKAAFEYMIRGELNVTIECNPLGAPLVAEVIEQMERGETPEKYIYLEEGIFSAEDAKELIDSRIY